MEALLQYIYENYKLKAKFIEEFPTGNYGITMKLEIEGQFFVLKLIPYEENHSLNKILPFMHFLASKGANVPYPVKDYKGNLYSNVNYKDNVMSLYIYPMLEGENLEDSIEDIISCNLTSNLGKMIAQLHKAMAEYPQDKLKGTKTWDEGESLFAIYETLNDNIPCEVVNLYNEKKKELKQLNIEMKKMIHCDLHMANILYDKMSHKFKILDMEDCVLGNRLMDLSTLCFDMSILCQSETKWKKGFQDLLSGYEHILSISDDEKKAIPIMVKILEIACYINFYEYKNENDPWMKSFFCNREEKILKESIISVLD